MIEGFNIRYVKSINERQEQELCIDLVNGGFAPSWDIKNAIYYSVGAPKLNAEDYINAYKRYLIGIWQHDGEEDTTEAQLKDALQRIKNKEYKHICVYTPSGESTPYSEIFMNFLKWVLTTGK